MFFRIQKKRVASAGALALIATSLLHRNSWCRLEEHERRTTQVYSWGYGNFGQLGLGSEAN